MNSLPPIKKSVTRSQDNWALREENKNNKSIINYNRRDKIE
jgi:hypothetical protein